MLVHLVNNINSHGKVEMLIGILYELNVSENSIY